MMENMNVSELKEPTEKEVAKITLPATPRNGRILLAAQINPRDLKVCGWEGSRSRGRKPLSWLLPNELLPAYEAALAADVQAVTQKRKATAEKAVQTRRMNKILGLPTAARRKEQERNEREAEARSMGLLPDSRTYARYLLGDIGHEEAIRIGRITSYRHEQTNYDDLLRAGYDKDDARELMTEV
jgi:hypothetical protein